MIQIDIEIDIEIDILNWKIKGSIFTYIQFVW